MEHILLPVTWKRADLEKLTDRYHFERTDIPAVERVFRIMKPSVRPEICFEVADGSQSRLHALDLTDNDRFVCCAVTLGAGVDGIQEEYMAHGALLEAYMAECLGMELLQQAYRELEKILESRHGLYIKRYDFPGERLEMECAGKILHFWEEHSFRPLPVSYRIPGVLLPKKSVVFIGELTEEKTDCTVCSGCSRKYCENRMNTEGAKG